MDARRKDNRAPATVSAIALAGGCAPEPTGPAAAAEPDTAAAGGDELGGGLYGKPRE
jgi:hypothetical protein